MYYKYLLTQQSMAVVVLGRTYTVSSHHGNFREVVDAVQLGREPVELLRVINRAAETMKAAVEASLRKRQLTGLLTYEEGMLYYDGMPLHNAAAERLLEMLKLGYEAGPLTLFVEKQQQNPSEVVVEHLYSFMEKGKMPITQDGDFLAYKAVRSDYMDIHSGTIRNAIGDTPSVPYQSVDPDRDRTCSYGLHVCSYAYLPSFADARGHVMICKVNPTDVVAIPSDYNDTKMRVCRYEVVEEVTSYYQRGENVLSQDLLADERYEVRYHPGACSGIDFEVYDVFYTAAEAIRQANALCKDGVERAWVTDLRTNEPIHDTTGERA